MTEIRIARATIGRKAALVFCLLFLAGGTVVFAQAKQLLPLSSADGKTVRLSVADLGSEARFYSYTTARGAVVRFFALLDASGAVHVAFDACDVCYQAKKGYRVINGSAICNNCGRRFSVQAIGKDNLTGGCWPSYLGMTAAGGTVTLSVADIEKKQYLFPF